MDSVLRTHYEGFYLATVRKGGFFTDKVKQGSSSSSSSLRSRQVAAVHLSLETNQVTNYNPYSSDNNKRLRELVNKRKWGKGFAHLKNMVVSRGEIPDLAATRRLIEELCKAGKPRMAAQVVEFLERSHGKTTLDDVRVYNELILVLCKVGQIDNALKLFHRMEEEEGGCRCSPDSYTFNILIKAMLEERGFAEGVKFLDEMRRSRGFEPDAVTRGTVVDWLCKEGRLDEAVQLVNSDGWPPCVVSYNAVINGLCEAGRLMDAEKLLAGMSAQPSAFTFRILISTLCGKGFLGKAIDLLESMMPKYGCNPDQTHYKMIIQTLCKRKKLGMAMECIEVMISRSCYPNTTIFNILLAALWKDCKVDAGNELFRELKSSRCCSANTATYSIVIEGLSTVGRAYEATQVLHEMLSEKGFEPDASTYTKLITGLIREGKCDDVVEILEELEGLEQVVLPWFSYNWFVEALCSVGETDRAIDLAVYMVSKGRQPSRAVYAALVEGLASAGLVKEGIELLNELSLRGAWDKGWTMGVATRIENVCRLD